MAYLEHGMWEILEVLRRLHRGESLSVIEDQGSSGGHTPTETRMTGLEAAIRQTPSSRRRKSVGEAVASISFNSWPTHTVLAD